MPRLARSRFHAAAALLSAALLAGCSQPRQPEQDSAAEPAARSKPVPVEVTVELIDGPGYAALLEQHRGRVVLVDFWATWCAACVELFPHTLELHERLADRDLSVVTVSLDEPEDKARVLEFLKARGATTANYLSGHGGSDKSWEAFGLEGGLPQYQLYDRQGNLHRTFAPGTENLDPNEIDLAVELLLGQE